MAEDNKRYTIDNDLQTMMASEPELAYSVRPVHSSIRISVSQQFRYHYQMWIKETGPMSNPYAIAQNEHLKKIVAMGKTVVPYIISELRERDECMTWDNELGYSESIA